MFLNKDEWQPLIPERSSYIMGPKAMWTPLPRNSRPRAPALARMKRRSNLRGNIYNCL